MKKTKAKKVRKIHLVLYAIYTLVFIGITAPLVLFWGPYKNVRKVFVSTLLATRHAYYLTDIFSQDTLNDMMGKTEDINSDGSQDLNKIAIECTTGNDVQLYKDEEDKYTAYILEIKSPLNILANDSCAAKPIIIAIRP